MVPRKAKNTTRQGANFELQIMADLERYGYTTLRSSGSRGAVDVVAVGDSHVLWIQAKITNPVISPAERVAVIDLAGRSNGFPIVAHRDNGKVLYRELVGTGPKDWDHFQPAVSGRAVCARCEHECSWHTGHTGCWDDSSIPGSTYMCDCPEFEVMTNKQYAAWKAESK